MIKKFTLEAEFNTETEHLKIHKTNQGFTALEILGIMEMQQHDLLKQIYNPNDFERVAKGDE